MGREEGGNQHTKRGFLGPGQRKGSLFPASQPPRSRSQGRPSASGGAPHEAITRPSLQALASKPAADPPGEELSPLLFISSRRSAPGSRFQSLSHTDAELKGQTSMISSCEGRRGFRK